MSAPADRLVHAPSAPAAWRLFVSGRVQAVGFRPFVYRLAHAHGLHGWARNTGGGVAIHVEGEPAALARFREQLLSQGPPLARPRLDSLAATTPEGQEGFELVASEADDSAEIHLPPDRFACDNCLAELRDPAARRYRYPFINCTQCGPRYTIVRGMPYDRAQSSMAGFTLCADCRREFEDPCDRRFHAQPLACPRCGPRLRWQAEGERREGDEAALAACRDALARGHIVAVRGIGGYHLLCDAADEAAVQRLRERKRRPDKPLAVMVPQRGADGLALARRLADLDPAAAERLRDPIRPIVLVRRRDGAPLAASIAPGLDEVGLLLPYSPLHHLLLDDFGGPLVATSGNVSGEPVLTEPDDAEARLGHIADAFVHHDRPIERPADDPVYRCIAGRARPLRLGRGTAPVECELPAPLAVPTLATGAFLKNTVALGWDRRVVISPHLGDLDSPRARRLFERVAADLQQLYGVTAAAVACDAHPGFPNSRWARDSGLPLLNIQHHTAHASALAAEAGGDDPLLVFAWDGVGFGADGTLWGGEALLGRPGNWQRHGRLRPLRLPGGDAAVAQPWRTALALAWEAGIDWQPATARVDPMLRHAWERGLNCPQTSAVGRLFDGAAALIGLIESATFEGQAPMRLEAAAGDAPAITLPLARDGQGRWETDWRPLVPLLADPARGVAERAGILHATLAEALAAQARAIAPAGLRRVGLAGGVFQNHRLCVLARRALAAAGFEVFLPAALPVNDAAISFGQLVEAAGQPS